MAKHLDYSRFRFKSKDNIIRFFDSINNQKDKQQTKEEVPEYISAIHSIEEVDQLFDQYDHSNNIRFNDKDKKVTKSNSSNNAKEKETEIKQEIRKSIADKSSEDEEERILNNRDTVK